MSLKAYTEGVVALHQQAQRIGATFGIEVPVTEKQLRQYSKQILLYKCLAVGLVVSWAFVLDASLGCLVTLAAMTQGVGFAVLAMKAAEHRSVAGISRKMLLLSVVATLFRCQSTLLFHGYLPYFGMGEFLFPLFDLGVAGLAVYTIALTYKFGATYEAEADSMWVFWVVPLALILGYVTKADANGNEYTDSMWMAAVWVEGFSMLPQIWMGRMGCNFRSVTAHFVALVFAARLMGMMYWFESYELLKLQEYEWGVGLLTWNYPGYSVVAAHALQVLSMGDFMYYYIKQVASHGTVLAFSGKMDL
mmetsp:Transcript_37162/g.89371  ORF Transcript_37162/g.89371 Transcript_37162/m.89371 type:complete len:305 (+) Transcript_37162:59-973(+)